MSVPINPASDYVVAVAEAAETKTASGIFLPDKAQEKPKVAKIMAVGRAVKEFRVGDRIVYKNYSTSEIKIGSSEYIFVKEEDILGTVK